MIYLIYSAIVVFTLYISYGTLFYGSRSSISRLGMDWNRWLFMLMIWTMTLLVAPMMFDITPEPCKFIVFFICVGLALTGGASLTNADDIRHHWVGAIVACGCSLVWLCIINPVLMFIPLILLAAGGYDRWQWNLEIGIILSVITATLI